MGGIIESTTPALDNHRESEESGSPERWLISWEEAEPREGSGKELKNSSKRRVCEDRNLVPLAALSQHPAHAGDITG